VDKPINIFVERSDANSDNFILVEFLIENGVFVSKGTLVAEVETAKAILEVEVDIEGYFWGNQTLLGETLNFETPIGALFILKADYFAYQDTIDNNSQTPGSIKKSKESLKITKKAKKLAEKHDIVLDNYEFKGLIREKDIINIICNKDSDNNYFIDPDEFKKIVLAAENPLVLVGPGSGADSIWEILNRKYNLICIVGCVPENVMLTCDIIIPTDDQFFEIINSNIEIANKLTLFYNVGINMGRLKKIVDKYNFYNFLSCNAIHSKSIISESAAIANGNYIGPGVAIGPGATIGKFNWVGAQTNIDHHNTIGSFNLIGPGVMFSGNCSIGNENILGAGVSVRNRIDLGDKKVFAIGESIKNNQQ